MNSRDRYEIIGLQEILHSIKQPCRSVCQKKALEMLQISAVPQLNEAENRIFQSTVSF